jgi:hypothetical protein
VKHAIKNIEFNFIEQIVSLVAKFWDDLTFEDVQHVFEEWLRVLSGSLQMEENTSSRKSSFELHYSADLGLRQGAKTVWTPDTVLP